MLMRHRCGKGAVLQQRDMAAVAAACCVLNERAGLAADGCKRRANLCESAGARAWHCFSATRARAMKKEQLLDVVIGLGSDLRESLSLFAINTIIFHAYENITHKGSPPRASRWPPTGKTSAGPAQPRRSRATTHIRTSRGHASVHGAPPERRVAGRVRVTPAHPPGSRASARHATAARKTPPGAP